MQKIVGYSFLTSRTQGICNQLYLSYILFSLILTLHYTATAQRIPFKNYSREHGLAHSSVYDIYEDDLGFLWFATGYGLSRFDGLEFTNYGAEEGLKENFVIALSPSSVLQKNSPLWLGTWGDGLQLFTNGRIAPYRSLSGQIPRKIKFLHLAKNGKLFIANNYEAGFLEKGHYTVLDFGTASKNKSFQINCMYEDARGTMLIGTTDGLYTIPTATPISYLPRVVDFPVFSLDSDVRNRLLIGSKGKVFTLTGDTTLTPIIIKELPSDGEVRTIRFDAEGNIWGAIHNKGIFIAGTPAVDISATLDIKSTHINDIHQDREGGFWLSSYGLGIFYLHDLNITNYTGKDGLPSNFITSLCRTDTGSLLVGTRNGLGIVKQNSIHSIILSHRIESTEYIVDIARDSTGAYWVITNNLMYQLKLHGGTLRASLKKRGRMYALYVDRSGMLWFGSSVGIMRLHPDNPHHWVAVPIPILNRRRITDIVEDTDNRMWFATDSGAYCYKNGITTHFTTACGLPHNYINAIEVNSNGIWLATDKGLALYRGNEWKIYTTKDGLSENACIVLATDTTGKLWIGSNRSGLNIFDGQSFTHINSKNGLISDEIQALHITGSGTWIGTGRGLTHIKPVQNQKKSLAIPVYIAALRFDNSSFMPGNIPEIIPHKHNSIRIDYIGLNYQNAADIIYRYTIPEINEQWSETALRSVNYSSLPPGTYTFLVQARKKGTATFSAPVAITFTIETPFWLSWWFRLTMYAVILLTAYYIIRYRFRYEKNKQIREISLSLHIIQLEQQALQALMNPHFIFNVLNSIQRYLYSNNSSDAAQYLAKFARLIRRIVDDAGEQYLPLSEEMEKLELYLELEKLRFEDKLHYEINISPELDKYSILIPTMILQPYVENAVWHGIMPLEASGTVRISVDPHDKTSLCITIEDDGVGMENSCVYAHESTNKQHKTEDHRSSGMKLTRERLHLMAEVTSQVMEVNVQAVNPLSKERPGTKVSIILPQ